MKDIIILGAGPAARYVAYILSYQKDDQIIGFLDNDIKIHNTTIYGKPILGDDSIIPKLKSKGVSRSIVGIGEPSIRRDIRYKLKLNGLILTNAIHPTVFLSPEVKLGKGIVIEAGSIMSDNPIISDNVWVGISAWVSHDTVIGKDCSIGGGACVGANVIIGNCTRIGMGAVIQSSKKIGKGVIIGSGANVVKDVPDYSVIVGNPGRVIKFNEQLRKKIEG